MTSGANLDRTWAIVPLRGLEDAKTRLGGALDAEERLELVTTMAIRTLSAARDAARLTGTVLVTADPAAARLAERFGATTLVQRLPGLNAALREARTVALAAGASGTMIVPIDLPAVSAEALDDVLARAGDAARAGAPAEAGDPADTSIATGPTRERGIVILVPDHHGTGTNVLLTSPPGVIDPAFGEGSRQSHRVAAQRAGASYLELDGPLAVDLDTSDDLLASGNVGGGSGAA